MEDNETKEDFAFDVEIVSTGQILHVPVGKPIVEVLIENSVDIITSCEQGICGSCVAKYIHGEIDHRDQLLTDEEKANNFFTPCCSRARSAKLVLDL
jgi:vanillate O-demethylase ferredoxin subunit